MPSQSASTAPRIQPSMACGPPIAPTIRGMVMNGPTPIMSIMLRAVALVRVSSRARPWLDWASGGAAAFRLLVAGTEQVYIEADGAGHAVGQLAEKSVSVVDVSPFAVAGAQQTSGKRRFIGIVRGKQRLEVRIPLAGEIETALLHPSVEIFG